MKTILIVEDDKHIASALNVRFTAHGFNVAHAYDAATALMVARNANPDLVVLDISMPGGDGFVVAERLRKWKGDDLPLVFITASKQPGLREKAADFNTVSFVEKPFDGEQLVDAVAAAV